MRKSSRRATNSSVAAVLIVLWSAGCTHFGGKSDVPVGPDDACVVLDSALATSGLRAGLNLRGKVTIDVSQYRVRGRFNLVLSGDGDLVFEMTSTTLLGGHREDVVLSFHADTVRVLDRERGRLFQGDEVDAQVEDGTGTPIAMRELLRRVLASPPDCSRLSGLRQSNGGARLEGRIGGGEFELRFERGRMATARWPLPLRGGHPGERFECTYSWVGGRLDGFVVLVRDSGWRIKLTDVKYN